MLSIRLICYIVLSTEFSQLFVFSERVHVNSQKLAEIFRNDQKKLYVRLDIDESKRVLQKIQSSVSGRRTIRRFEVGDPRKGFY